MNDAKKLFAAQLLAADLPSSESRQRNQVSMNLLFEKTLTRDERKLYFSIAVIMALLSLLCVAEAVYAGVSQTIDPAFIGLFGLTAVALLVVAGILFKTARKGIITRHTSGNWEAGAGVLYAGLAGCLFVMLSETLPERLRDAVKIAGIVLLGYAVVAWVRHRIAQAEMRTAEKLLEIELRLAKIGEQLESRGATTAANPD
jgi:hypothetical protein